MRGFFIEYGVAGDFRDDGAHQNSKCRLTIPFRPESGVPVRGRKPRKYLLRWDRQSPIPS